GHRDQGGVIMPGRRKVAAVLAVLAIVCVGCSTSSNSASTPSSSTGQGGGTGTLSSTGSGSGRAATGTPSKVGIMCSCTGAARVAEPLVTNGYHAWAQATNDAGGINGHPIQLITEDDQATPGLAVTKAHELVSEGVVAVEV